MFDMIAIAKCDVCPRTFTWGAMPFKVEAPFRIRVPDNWRLVSISRESAMKQILMCDDHGQDRIRDLIILVEKPIPMEVEKPAATEQPANVNA